MSSLHRAINRVHRLDDLAAGDTVLHRLPPMAKLLSVVVFLIFLMSFSRYAVTGVLSFLGILLVLYPAGELSLWEGVQSAKGVVVFLTGLGLVNAWAAPAHVLSLGPFSVPGSVLVFLVLVGKGVLSCLAVVLLLATTRMEDLCAGLISLHVPKILAVTLLLLVRYLVLLLQEGRRMYTAFSLRAPGKKGLPRNIWGSFLGMWFLRSLDKAQQVYEAMTLRGFHGCFPQKRYGKKAKQQGFFLFIGTLLYCLGCRVMLG